MGRRRRSITAAPTDWWLRAGYGGLLGFFVLEKALRQPGSASSLNASQDDRGTTRMIIAAYAIGTDLPLMSRRLSIGRLPAPVAPAGLAIQAGGLALRAWSMRTLGGFYTRTLKTERDQQNLVEHGPYRLVRHPGYLGSILTWSGFALASRSGPTIGLVTGLLGAAYAQRINAEERLLQRDLPGYIQYTEGTKKLIPFVW